MSSGDETTRRASLPDSFGHLDEQDELDDEERARLQAAIRRGVDEMKAGKGIPAEQVLTELRQRR